MCAINGFTWDDERLIEMMNDATRHRGPDGDGTYVNDEVSIGHRRLSIIDLSSAGRQPMANEDESAWIVFNGEIYNYESIKYELQDIGHEFKSETDTEVVIHAYEEWGYDCLERFNGMWAFGIYDKKKRLLFLSRDRFGVKPLYYQLNSKGMIFSSEIKGILVHNIERSPNEKALYEYLSFGLLDYSEETFFQGIYRLMPGEILIYDLTNKSFEKFKWYDLKSRAVIGPGPISEEDLIREIRDLFEDSVRHRMIADVPVGSCLSGGIDSSSIVCAMRKLAKDTKIKTFSMIFPGYKIDESTYIDEVVAATEAESHRFSPTTEDLMDDLYDLIRTQEEPFGSLSIYGQYKVMEMAHKNDMKVLLDGQGADELFSGYFIYYKYYLFESLLNLRIREGLKVAKTVNYNMKDLLIFPAASLLSMIGFSSRLFKIYLSKHTKHLNAVHLSGPTEILSERGFDLNRALYSNLTRDGLPQLLRYEDKNSMRWSIEARVPFLDYRLVELVSSLPSHFKIRDGVTKYIFRKAIRGLVPDRIVGRRDKIGFATPDGEWMASDELVGFAKDIFISQQFRSRTYWKQEEVMKLLEDHEAGRRNHCEMLWRLINAELWLRILIEKTDIVNDKEKQL
ncbi:asparagine synthase (glutamine-hydrolyzing) [Candidatus Methanocrinis natronophilus]|uniref:Putative asparagine synthetase [glutamine-hydrolyzing] n=1 Tax=Candidatus Methanocrinis natronophilus TaxID=3033396 RepID=A0ABT5X9L9_9EURY|nr:asparagine synthase (glutamine-hydrolyzing) [Candidatus Methanocrinis natronophilus]MDF0591409.1 asparagine synthase (glutamine-hydrolyzing) [Candidatus Methanocrinis natronophilus]